MSMSIEFIKTLNFSKDTLLQVKISMLKNSVKKYIYPNLKEKCGRGILEILKLYDEYVFGGFLSKYKFKNFIFYNAYYLFGVETENISTDKRKDKNWWFIYLFQESIIRWLIFEMYISFSLKYTNIDMEYLAKCFYEHLFGSHKINKNLPPLTWSYHCSDTRVYCPLFHQRWSMGDLIEKTSKELEVIANNANVDISDKNSCVHVKEFITLNPSKTLHKLVNMMEKVSKKSLEMFDSDEPTKNNIVFYGILRLLFGFNTVKKNSVVLTREKIIDIENKFFITPMFLENSKVEIDIKSNPIYKDLNVIYGIDEFVEKNKNWIKKQFQQQLPFLSSIQNHIKGKLANTKKITTFPTTQSYLNLLNMFSLLSPIPADVIVHRTIFFESNNFKVYKDGNIKDYVNVEKGFMSTSLAFQLKNISKDNPTFMSLFVPKNTLCACLLSTNYSESEILFPPQTKFVLFKERELIFDGKIAKYYFGFIYGFPTFSKKLHIPL